MLITFARADDGSTVATIRRGDGVVLELPGYDRKYRVPHDLAHAATERELEMPCGVFGSIAGGGVFSTMSVLAGRVRHDADDRSTRLLEANKDALGVAEVMAGVVHDAVENGTTATAMAEAQRVWGLQNGEPFPWTEAHLTAAFDALTRLAAVYERDGLVYVDWPETLTSPVPERQERRWGRRGRL
ncbi:MAG: hypothetical protein ABW022_03745 [Actinoplanes sp.]